VTNPIGGRELPPGWRLTTVDAIKSPAKHSCVAGPFGSSISSKFFQGEGVPVIRGANLTFGRDKFIDDGFVFISPEKANTFKAQTAVSDDLIFTCWGTIGQVGLIPENSRFPEYVISNKQLKLRVDREIIRPAFAYYYFSSPNVVRHIQNHGIGAAVPGINLGILKACPVSVPPLRDQDAIIGVLSAFDNLIQANARRIAILEEMARLLFDEWFVRLRVPGGEPDSMVADELGPGPGGWTPTTAGELIDFDPRTAVPKDGEKYFVPMGALSTNSMVIDGWEMRDGNAGSKFQNGDTLLARITPCLENGKTGYVDFLPPGSTAFGSTEYIVMRGRQAPSTFVCLLARSPQFRETAIKSMGGADGRQRVRSEALAGFKLLRPPANRLAGFDQVVSPMFEQMRVLADSNARLRDARDMLLPKLISGEIAVGQAERALEHAA
jgi:type I restriction enzyme S subunit